jgi:hypothetical protein
MPASDHAVPLPEKTVPAPSRKARFRTGRARRWASLLGGVAFAAAALRIRARRRAALATVQAAS